NADGGTVSGSSNVEYHAAFDGVSIVNASSRDLKVGTIDILAQQPALFVGDGAWTSALTTVWNATAIDIRNTNAAAADADIILTGDILNEQGTTTIVNAAGNGSDILRADTTA